MSEQSAPPGLFKGIEQFNRQEFFECHETLEEIWSNQTNKARDDCGNLAKFSYPTIANGKVYLPSFSKQVCVYGLL